MRVGIIKRGSVLFICGSGQLTIDIKDAPADCDVKAVVARESPNIWGLVFGNTNPDASANVCVEAKYSNIMSAERMSQSLSAYVIGQQSLLNLKNNDLLPGDSRRVSDIKNLKKGVRWDLMGNKILTRLSEIRAVPFTAILEEMLLHDDKN